MGHPGHLSLPPARGLKSDGSVPVGRPGPPVIPADWINDRDQFFAPKDGWQRDYTFLSDYLVNTIFHRQNRISFAYH